MFEVAENIDNTTGAKIKVIGVGGGYRFSSSCGESCTD